MDADSVALLADQAKAAMQNAYAPYSGFRVGAALLAASGRIYVGCNVENASYGATICAERSAVAAAVSAGDRRFTAIAVVSDAPGLCSPCGICRQVLSEFGDDILVVRVGPNGGHDAKPISYYLPAAFRDSDMESGEPPHSSVGDSRG